MKVKIKGKTLETSYNSLLITVAYAQADMSKAVSALLKDWNNRALARDAQAKIEYFNDICEAIDELWPIVAERNRDE